MDQQGSFKAINPVIDGVTPFSSPNVASLAINHKLVNGQLTLAAFGHLTPAAGVHSFSLSSFRFGCYEITETNLAAVVEGCALTVSGTYVGGGQVPEMTFAFAPTKLTANTMALAELPVAEYSNLANVTIAVAGSAIAVLTIGVYVDNLVHCNHS